MPTAKVSDLNNKKIGEVRLSDSVFGVEFKEGLIHEAVKNYLANGRQGTVKTKSRGNVRGGGRKPWRQKGTGNARVASIRSPLWRGGGRAHGPVPRDWSYKFPKKMRRGALRSALSEKLREGNLIILDEIILDNPKTRDFTKLMSALGLVNKKRYVKTLLVDSLSNENLILASRNVKNTKVVGSHGVNIYDLIYNEKIVVSKAAAKELNDLLDTKREKKKKMKEEAA